MMGMRPPAPIPLSSGPMPTLLAELFPLLYGVCFLFLLWQAFRVMGRGFRAMGRPDSVSAPASADRRGKVTIHPELLDADGQITREDLLTVRFSDDSGEPVRPAD